MVDYASLQRCAGEALWDYYMRIEEVMFDAFKSLHSFSWDGACVEACFDPEAETFDADWALFAEAGLETSIVRRASPPEIIRLKAM